MRRAMICLAVLAVCLPAFGWWDTQVLRLANWPVEQVFEAEDIGIGNPLDDAGAFGGKAVRMNGKSPAVKLTFKNLDIGCYGVFINARAEGDQIETVRRPVLFELTLDSEPAGKTATHIVRVCYGVLYEAVAHIYFQANRKGDIHATLRMLPESRAELIVDRIELRNPLHGIPRKRAKRGPTLFSRAEREALWAEAKAGKPKFKFPLTYFDKTARTDTPAARAERDRNIWRALPPLNVALTRGRYANDKPAVAAMKALDPEGNAGTWARIEETHQNTYNWRVPLALVNEKLGLRYTYEDLVAHRPLPKPYPWPDAGWGAYVGRDDVVAEVGAEKAKGMEYNAYVAPIAPFVSQQYGSIQRALHSGAYPWPALPQRYFQDGDMNAARDGAFLLAIYAYNYPTMNNRPVTIGMLDSPQGPRAPNRFTQSNAGFGKTNEYSCGSEHTFMWLVEAYDKLFDFIDGNQELADALKPYIPWIETPDDVLIMIDRRLLGHGRLALDNMRLRCGQGGWESTTSQLALALGPGEVGSRVWEMFFTRAYMDMTNSGGFQDHYVCSYSRDGINHMGSTSYSAGSYLSALGIAGRVKRYAELGGDVKYPLHDPKAYPRLIGSTQMPLRLNAGGGWVPVLGDAGDLTRARTFVGDLGDRQTFSLQWAWTKSPDAAWMLANVIGRGEETDEEWAAIATAAATARDPRLYAKTHSASGFGLTYLEDGEESPDWRFKRTVAFRTGIARGHSHEDGLNIELFALGARMAPDLGGRHEGDRKSHPDMTCTRAHNTVEVDETGFWSVAGNGTAWTWIDDLRAGPGCDVVRGSGSCQRLPQVTQYTRTVAQIAVHEGREGKTAPSTPVYGPTTKHDPDIEYPASYVFDVFRVKGGRVHSWGFHGAHGGEDGAFTTNAPLAKAASKEALAYLSDFREGTQREAKCLDALQATWRLDRKFEEGYMGPDFTPDGPRKYTRVTMLGQGDANVLVATAWTKHYRYEFPFLYVQRRGEDLRSVFPAIIETYAGEPTVRSARLLTPVHGEAVGVEVKTVNGRTDLCWQSERAAGVAGDATIDARFAYFSRDEKGPRMLTLVGGKSFEAPGLSVKVAQAEHRGRIVRFDPEKREIELDVTLPETALDGVEFQVGNPRHWTSNRIVSVRKGAKGSIVTFEQSAKVYQSVVTHVDPQRKRVSVEIDPPLLNADERYYDGTTAMDEAGRFVWKPTVRRDERWMYLGWPESQRAGQRMTDADVTDADRDGRRTLKMYQETEAETADMTKHLVDLEVTRIDPAAMMLYFKMPDDTKYQTGGWAYWGRRLINEAGTREWRAIYPGTVVAFELAGDAPVTADAFTDADGDGRRLITLYDFGPGDLFRVPTQLVLARNAAGKLDVVKSDVKADWKQ